MVAPKLRGPIVVFALAALSVLFLIGVLAGWWPYQWWEAFR